jgi:hypothetical protein
MIGATSVLVLLTRFAGLICLALATGVLFVVGLIVAPEIDERVGFFTVRATKTVQAYEVNGIPLRRIVERKFETVRWRAYHQDIPFETFVECVGTPHSGGPERRMLWFVKERPRWSEGRWGLRVTVHAAVNDEALALTPQLDDISALVAPHPSQQGQQ